MRALWTGSISFGLINIPVRLYSGSDSRDGIDLRMLHKKDLSPIRYSRVCRKDGKEIPYDQIVKGYEYQDGDYITLEEADFKKADAEKTTAIEISLFADAREIDIRYYDKPYYLEPAKGAEKPYALLREALAKSGKVAVARFVMRGREHLAAITPVERALVLEQMRFTDELRRPTGLKLPTGGHVAASEIELAMKLVKQLSGAFIPEDYHDTYTEELEEIIEEKAKGHKPKPHGKAPTITKSHDLMATLKASLDSHPATKTKRN